MTAEEGEGSPVARVDEVKLEEFSIPELEELGKRVAKQIEIQREKLKRLAFEEIEQLAEKHGLTLKEVLQAGQKPRKRQPPKQKYRNPEKPSQTWSGRGKKPAWVEKVLSSGKALKELEI